MANAVKRLQNTTARTFKILRTDRFLADAHWALAENVCEVQNPYIVGELYEVQGRVMYLWAGGSLLKHHSLDVSCIFYRLDEGLVASFC